MTRIDEIIEQVKKEDKESTRWMNWQEFAKVVSKRVAVAFDQWKSDNGWYDENGCFYIRGQSKHISYEEVFDFWNNMEDLK